MIPSDVLRFNVHVLAKSGKTINLITLGLDSNYDVLVMRTCIVD